MKYIRLVVYLIAIFIGSSLWFSVYLFPGFEWPVGFSAFNLIGIFALIFLYLSLLPSPLYEVFPNLPGKLLFQRAKKALGISSFFFAAAYATILWLALQRVADPGPVELEVGQMVSAYTGAGALFILAVLAVTSIKAIKQRIRPWWKTLHRSVYLAAGLLAIHVGNFSSSRTISPKFVVAYLLIEFLLLIQLIRFDRFFRGRYPTLSRSIVSMGFPLVSLLLFWVFFLN